MKIFNKLANLIFEEEPSNSKKEKTTSTKSWKDIFFEDITEDNNSKKGSWKDLFFEEEADDDIQSKFVTEGEQKIVLTNIACQIERKESELVKLGVILKSVKPTDYPDSSLEYEAYLSLIKQIHAMKELLKGKQNSNLKAIILQQLESSFQKFQADYRTHINSIKTLCYLSEIATINEELSTIFSENFSRDTEHKIEQKEKYLTLISQKSDMFVKKYTERIYTELIEAEYRLTLLKLMKEIYNENPPRKNPFSKFSPEKRTTFETYLSKDFTDTNTQYNTLADNRKKYTKYKLVKTSLFYEIDDEAEAITEKINQYTIDNFLLDELLENGEGYETLKNFLSLKIKLNFIDSKTSEADKRAFEDNYGQACATTMYNNRNTQTFLGIDRRKNSSSEYEL